MSDYNCWIRTNYFRVKDENALEELVMDEFTAYRIEKLRTKRKRIMARSLPDCRSSFRLARR